MTAIWQKIGATALLLLLPLSIGWITVEDEDGGAMKKPEHKCRGCKTLLISQRDIKFGHCMACYKPHSGPTCRSGHGSCAKRVWTWVKPKTEDAFPFNPLHT